MAVGGAAGLFASLIFHDLAHSLVARRFGIPITGITLFIFGGVAHMEEEPPSPPCGKLQSDRRGEQRRSWEMAFDKRKRLGDFER